MSERPGVWQHAARGRRMGGTSKKRVRPPQCCDPSRSNSTTRALAGGGPSQEPHAGGSAGLIE